MLYHLDASCGRPAETPAVPTEEDLLVLFLNGEDDDGVVRRLVGAGCTKVAA